MNESTSLKGRLPPFLRGDFLKNNILNYRHESSNFKQQLEKCETVYNQCGFAYIASYGVIAAVSLIYGIVSMITTGWQGFDIILNGTFFKIAAFIPAYLSVYKKENKYIIFSITILVLNYVTMIAISENGCVWSGFNAVFICFNIDCSLKTIFANNCYHFLEKQFGFPYFDEVKDERKFDEISRNIKDDFKIASEERRKTACDSMESIVSSGERISARTNNKNDFMSDVSLAGETSSDLTIKDDDGE